MTLTGLENKIAQGTDHRIALMNKKEKRRIDPCLSEKGGIKFFNKINLTGL
jgi:hypothetical protein